jgi:predicted nuclease with TOPRIM domain
MSKRNPTTTIEDLEKEVNRLNKKVCIIDTTKNNLENKIKKLNKKKSILLAKKYDEIYRICCKSDNKIHYVGAFTTFPKANEHIPTSGHSYDGDYYRTWYYSVVKTQSTPKLTKYLDSSKSLPKDYPYESFGE